MFGILLPISFRNTNIYPYISIIVGLGVIIFAGYITGRIAKKAEILNATLMGVITFLFMLLLSIGKISTWNIFAFFLSIPAASLGGQIAYKKSS